MARPVLESSQISDFRQRIIDSALALLGRGGVQAMSFRALGRELGCSHATPYRYFENKEAVVDAVREECFRRFAMHLESSLADATTSEGRLRRLCLAYFEFARAEPSAFAVMFALDAGQGRGPESRRAWGILHSAVEAAIADDVLEGSSTTIAHVFWSAVHGLTSLDTARQLNAGRSAHEVMPPMIDALIRAHAPGRRS